MGVGGTRNVIALGRRRNVERRTRSKEQYELVQRDKVNSRMQYATKLLGKYIPLLKSFVAHSISLCKSFLFRLFRYCIRRIRLLS